MLTPEQEYRRFVQQASWTLSIRQYVYQQIGLSQAGRVLEVGCGEGVILTDLAGVFSGTVIGLDKRLEALQFAGRQNPKPNHLTCGDAFHLPYPGGIFDATVCHFTLMWLVDPRLALKEMVRVTRPGGAVAALAEPDYGGRIDYPESLAQLGRLQARALSRLGADANLGRKLSSLLHQAGLEGVQTGVLGGQWSDPFSESDWEGEWLTLEDDLAGEMKATELETLRQMDGQARQKGERLLFVPTFYGWGRTASK
jgi:SAM-dependent methyltransferase